MMELDTIELGLPDRVLIDELKAEQAAIATQIHERIAALKARDGCLTQLETEHAYLDTRIQDERERAVGLRVGDKIETDDKFISDLLEPYRTRPNFEGIASDVNDIGEITRVQIYHADLEYHPDHVVIHVDMISTDCMFRLTIEDALRLRALYMKNHPVSLITE